MTTHPDYAFRMEHRPRFLDHGLPADGVLTVDTLAALPEDPWWKCELIDGALIVTSDVDLFTWDALQSIPDDPQWKYELIDGALIVTPDAPGLRHQDCAGSLYLHLRRACPPHLHVVIAPFEYKPEGEAGVQPDLMVARRPVGEKRLTHTPVLVVEILSRGTRMLDRTMKRAMYEERGVEHYWVIDPAGPSIEALRLSGGVYASTAKADAGQVFSVSEPVPVSFDPQDLLDD